MTLAPHISIESDKSVNHHFLWKIYQIVTALCKRLWWHTKAYTTVFGIMSMAFASLGFLYIQWSGKKLTQSLQNETVVEQK
ncbi:hypothetical protein NIES2100_74010 [Calothrix sp. NIES-2100]|uniref:hypothetical protein n=1 Tax=Calothrix sp. NIES-2100 TaxID=1954172 RepID=UPI000B60D083|nr:hypothetical protein NIES2100_74010 [Calothrix sp. NIES-2100]